MTANYLERIETIKTYLQQIYFNSWDSRQLGLLLVLILWSAVTAYAIFYAASYANLEHAKRWPLQGDTTSYWARDISLTRPADPSSVAHQSYWDQVLEGAKQNGKDPIRTVFYGLLPRDAPTTVNGHLYFSATTAFLFIFFLVKALHRRANSFVYALGASILALLPYGLMNTMYGLPSKLPDLPASYLFGAALFAVFSSRADRKSELIWIFVAGLMLGLATLSRFQLWIYGLFTLGPIVFLVGVRRYLIGGRRIADLFVYPVVLLTGVAITAGYFIATWAREIFEFYSIAGYSLNSTIAASLSTTGRQFLGFLGVPFVLAGLLVFSVYLSIKGDVRVEQTQTDANKLHSRFDALVIIWALISYPILLFFVIRVESIIEQSYYVVPGLLLFLLVPFNRDPKVDRVKGFKVFSASLVLILPMAVAANTYGYVSSESFLYPREREVEIARFQRGLAELVAVHMPVAENVPSSTVDTNFFYYGRILELIARGVFGRNCRSVMVFQIRQSQWELAFNGEEEIDKSLIMKALVERVDVFAALTKPKPSEKESTFVDDYTERLAVYVNQELEANPAIWLKKGSIVGPYGEVTVYENRTRAR